MGPFWGKPSATIRDKDVVKFIEVIRKVTETQSRDRRLYIATNAMKAIASVIVADQGRKEAMAVLDKVRSEIVLGETE